MVSATTATSTTRQRFPLDALSVDDTAADPLYRQLEEQLRTLILERRLEPGMRLPSTRRLATDLGVARNTVINAYDQLILEGYLVTARGSGTRVAHDLPEELLNAPGGERAHAANAGPLPLSPTGRRIAAFSRWIEVQSFAPPRPFRAHTAASDAFPRKLWARLAARRLRTSRDLLERSDPRGYRPLREAIAAYLGSARGVACTADQVIVTAGVQQGIELIAKLLVEPGAAVCMEDPGYAPGRVLFELAGARVFSVPVDAEGIEVGRLEEEVPTARIVYVTPSSQFPLGMTMSLARRLALIEWAAQSDALILEDDYNGEYRYAGRPLPALYGLAPPGRVIYTGSFSKLLIPSLRIGYVVVPPDAVDVFAAARWLVDRHSPPLEQAVLTEFIDEGHFARHVRRMRTLYAERQAALVDAASKDLDGILDVPAMDAGLHLIGWLGDGVGEASLLNAAAAAGLELAPTSWFADRELVRPSVILGYAPFRGAEIRRATRALSAAFRGPA
ncbi:MAG: PLP-dependent aminotransferase family protein [Pseudomonadota bacterium]